MGFPSDAFSTLLHISRPKLDGGRCQTDIHLTWDILDTRPTNKTQTRKYKYNKWWKLCYIFPNRRTILGIPTYVFNLYYLGFPNAKVVYSRWSGNFQMLGAKPDETKSFLIRQNESKQNLKLVMPFSLNTDQSFWDGIQWYNHYTYSLLGCYT